ncbi:MAG TPA: hypothetical protein VM076_04215 [Gemmatimonadaceae bacterium]|nr:hypothetical protein [Gemmatimonadaceae bacterium]
MADPVARRRLVAPNAGFEGDIALLLERVCSRLPHDYTRQLVRDVVRLKLEMGFEDSVRDYLKRRSGEYPVVKSS